MEKFWTDRIPAGLVGSLTLLVMLTGASLGNVSAQEPGSPPDLAEKQLTLQAALDLALEFNPQLLGFTAAENEALARADQAGRGLNPELGLEVEDFLGSGEYNGFSSAQYTLFLAQTFQLGGKPAKQKEAAGWNAEMVRLEAQLQVIDLKAAVSRVFIEILLAQQEIELTRDLVQLAEQDLEYVERRVKNGSLSLVEINRAQVALFSARMDLDSARQTLAIKKVRLSTMWNGTKPTFGTAVGNLQTSLPLPGWENLVGQLDRSPGLRQFDLQTGRLRAELAVAQAQGKIDLTASAGIRHYSDSGDNAAVATISIPLPVRNRNQDGIRAGKYGMERVGALRQGRLIALREDLASQHERMSRAHVQVVSIREEILPATDMALTRANDAFRKGLFSQTDVISVRRTWFELNSRYYRALAAYQTASVEIARILGNTDSLPLTNLEND